MKTITVHYTVREERWHEMELEVPDDLDLRTPKGNDAILRLLEVDPDTYSDATYDKGMGGDTEIGTILGAPTPEGCEDEGEREEELQEMVANRNHLLGRVAAFMDNGLSDKERAALRHDIDELVEAAPHGCEEEGERPTNQDFCEQCGHSLPRSALSAMGLRCRECDPTGIETEGTAEENST